MFPLILAEFIAISIINFNLSTHFEMDSFIFHFFLDMIYFTIISNDSIISCTLQRKWPQKAL